MTVSVIIPVYNGEKFIKNAIDSILNQSYKNLEIIIVDDCSTDKTQEIIRSNFKALIGDLILYHRNQKNMERSYSRNKGVELSKGEFIFFLDYDDIWERDYIENSVEYLKEYDIVYSFPRTFINEKGAIIRVSKKSIPDDVGKIIFSGQIGYPSATGFRKSSFLGYREDIILREDWEIFIRSYLNGLKIKVLDNNKVKMREHGGRTSRSKKMLLSTLEVYKEYIDVVPAQYKAEFLFHVSEISMRFGYIKEGWKLMMKAIEEKPSILLNKRNLLTIIKRGLRFDRLLKNQNY